MEVELSPSHSSRQNGSTAHAHVNGTAGKAPEKTASKPLVASMFRSGGLAGSDYLKLAVCTACGAIFGVATEKARGILNKTANHNIIFLQFTANTARNVIEPRHTFVI